MRSSRKFMASLACVLVALMMLLTACSSPASTSQPASGDKTQAATDQASAAATASAAQAPTDLAIGFFMLTQVPADYQLVLDALNQKLVEKANVKISTVNGNFGNYHEQLNLMLSSDEHLDAFGVWGSYFLGIYAKGQIIPLDDLLKTNGQGIVSAIGEDFLKAGQVNGKQYGLTTLRDLAVERGFAMLKEYLDKYNIDPASIKTLDDVAAVYKVIKEKEPNMVPLTASSGSNPMMDIITSNDLLGDGYGVLMNFGQDLKVVNYFDTQEYEDSCRYFRDWYQKGYITENVLTNTDTASALLRAGRAFSYTTNLKPGFELKESASVQKQIVGVSVVKPFTSTSIVQNFQWCIAHNSKAPAKAMDFLNLMYTDKDVINLMDWGIEGKHYVVQDDGLINYPEGVTADTIGYNLNLGWMFGNQFLSYVWKGDSPTLYQDLAAFNKGAVKSKAFGFTFDPSNVKTEQAAVANVCKQYRAGLEYGVLDPDTALPEFRQKLKEVGIDKIVAEKQAQLDAWAAAQ